MDTTPYILKWESTHQPTISFYIRRKTKIVIPLSGMAVKWTDNYLEYQYVDFQCHNRAMVRARLEIDHADWAGEESVAMGITPLIMVIP